MKTKKSSFSELFPGLFSESEIVILDFQQIPADLPEFKNIKLFFEKCLAGGLNPRLAENRQRFNDRFLELSSKRYLIGQYGEDRIEMLKGSRIAAEGRSIHLGLDIFTKDLETIYAPCDGEIVATGQQAGQFTFGYYLIFKPDSKVMNNYLFLGHLSAKLPELGPVAAGQPLATLGDYHNYENGGWSRHVHVQLLRELPPPGKLPRGYSTKAEMAQYLDEYPDPSFLVYGTA